MTDNPVLVTLFQEIVESIEVIDTEKNDGSFFDINYQPGRSLQIITDMINKDNAPSQKGNKYPLVALILPIREKRGGAFYSEVHIPRIVIMYYTKTGEGTERILDKYDSDGVFNTILRPIYEQLLQKISINPYIQVQDPDFIPHNYMENPCQQPEGWTDYVDTIEITGLQITLLQIKNC